ncbi:GAF domain-containing protein [Candidatus Poribacteria bacterium]|nr:GAF domain-containing protein [Candidatus Poribacteria bacterium]
MANNNASSLRQYREDEDRLMRSDKILKFSTKQRLVIEAGRVLGSEIDLDTLLDRIVVEALQVVDADRGSIWILDKEKNELWTKVATGISDRRLRVPVGKGLAGIVAQTGKTINIPDAYQDERFDPSHDRSTGYRTHSLLTVPMRNMHGNVTGVIQVLNQLEGVPFSTDDEELLSLLANHAAIAIENAQLYEDLEDSYQRTLLAMTSLLELRDQETENHSIRVVQFALRIAEEMGITDPNQIRTLQLGATLHDIGKIGISDNILLKPGRFTDEERKIMEKHTIYGYEKLRVLKNIPFIGDAALIVLHHHEKYNGKGYPMGLKGNEIPLGARIFMAADVLDALASRRPYKGPWPYLRIREEFVKCSGTDFDPRVVEAFLRIPPEDWEAIRTRVDGMPK